MPKPHKFHEIVRKLRKHDKKFQFFEKRGKGSERIIYHPNIDGRAVSLPIKCHGQGNEIGKGAIKDIMRRFNLPNNLF